MKKQFVIFLDHDGVTIDMGSRFLQDGKRNGFNLYSLGLLEHLQSNYDVKFVCSSRAHAKTTLIEQQKHLKPSGIDLVHVEPNFRTPYAAQGYDERLNTYLEKIGEYHRELYRDHYGFPSNPDPDVDYRYSRGRCILQWLLDNDYDPLSDDYLIIDDESDMFPLPPARFVHVKDGEQLGGFTFKYYRIVRRILETRGWYNIELPATGEIGYDSITEGIYITDTNVQGSTSPSPLRLVSVAYGTRGVTVIDDSFGNIGKYTFDLRDFMSVNRMLLKLNPDFTIS